MDVNEQIKSIAQGSAELINEAELKVKLERSMRDRKPLRIKFGADPSYPDLHLGHTVALRKLRDFQKLGHRILFVIGGFTARIGDPSGQSQTRKQLSKEEVRLNAKTYQEQVFRFLDRKNVEVIDNSQWLSRLSLEEMIQIASGYTVARMMERADFYQRFTAQQPIGIHEFIYPLMQGYDSVEIKADVEIGGTDQKFNLLVGRELQHQAGQEPQCILTLPLLVGTDGQKKMSKSLGNHIGIMDTPSDIYGKVMSLSDKLAQQYDSILFSKEGRFDGEHPLASKKALARRITEESWGPKKGEEAEKKFEAVVQNKETPQDLSEYEIVGESEAVMMDIIMDSGLASSRSEVRRLISQGGVKLDGQSITDPHERYKIQDRQVLKVGKRRFVRLRVKRA